MKKSVWIGLAVSLAVLLMGMGGISPYWFRVLFGLVAMTIGAGLIYKARKKAIPLLLILLMLLPLTVSGSPEIEDKVPEDARIVQLFNENSNYTNWGEFWRSLKTYMTFRLEYEGVSNWLEEEESLDVWFEYPEDNVMKYFFNFTAGKSKNYRIVVDIKIDTINFTEYEWYYELEYDNFSIKFDWSDLEDTPFGWNSEFENKKYRFYINVGDIERGEFVYIDPQIVGTTTSPYGIGPGASRNLFRAEGLFWVFYTKNYQDGQGVDKPIQYGTSPDGITWTEHESFNITNGDQAHFGIAYNGEYMAAVRHTEYIDLGGGVVPTTSFRLGEPQDDGSIDWVAGWQVVRAGSELDYDKVLIPIFDSNGHVFIGTRNREGGNTYHTVYRNTLTGGIWSGVKVNLLGALNAGGYTTEVIAHGGGKIYAVCTREVGDIARGYAWDGSTWSAQEAVTGVNLNFGWYGDGTGLDDGRIYYVYRSAGDNTPYYTLRTAAGVWGSVTQITARTATDIGVTRGSNNDMFFFYSDSTYDNIYYKKLDRLTLILGDEVLFGLPAYSVAQVVTINDDFAYSEHAGFQAKTFTAFTFSFRVKSPDGGTHKMVFERGNTTNDVGSFAMYKLSGVQTLKAHVSTDDGGEGQGIDSVTEVFDNTWHWVFLDYDGARFSVYVDTNSTTAHEDDRAVTGTVEACAVAQSFLFVRGSGPSLGLDGKIDDFRIYDDVLTEGERQAIMDKDYDNVPTANLVLELLFDDKPRLTSYEDTSGNDYDFTLYGSATWAGEDNYVITNLGTIAPFCRAWEQEVGVAWISNTGSPYWVNFLNLTDIADAYVADFEITNREIGADIIKADYKWYEAILTVYADSVLTKDHIGLRFNTSDGLTYTIWYNVSSGTYTYNHDTNWMVENMVYDVTNGFSSLTFDFYMLSYVADTSYVDFEGYINTTSGVTSEWDADVGKDYCELLSFTGVTKYTSYGNAGRIAGGDWMNIYADKDSTVRVEYITPNIQGVFMSIALNPTYGISNADEKWSGDHKQDQLGNYSFGMDYSIDGIGWIEGWRAEMYLYQSVLATGPILQRSNYMHWKVDWYRGDTLVKTDDLVGYFWGIDSGDDEIKFVMRFWFNRENASTVFGGWISPKEYGIVEGGWMFFSDWRPVTTVGANDSQAVKSFLFDSLPDENEETTGYRLIDTTRFWANVTRSDTGDVGQQYRIESIEALEMQKGGMMDSHHSNGILTPAPVAPILITTGFGGGVIRWIGMALTSLIRAGQMTLFSVIDGILLFITGEEGIFTSVMRLIGLLTGNFMTSVNLVLREGWTLFTTYIGAGYELLAQGIGYIFDAIRGLISPATFIWGTLSSVWGFINAWLTGGIWIDGGGNTVDFTNMLNVHYLDYVAGWAVVNGLLGLYVVFYIPVVAIAAGNGGVAAGVDYALAPFRAGWFIVKILWWCISLPLKAINWVLDLFTKVKP